MISKILILIKGKLFIFPLVFLYAFCSYENIYNPHYKEEAVKISLSNDAHKFMELRTYLGGLNTMIAATKDNTLINEQIMLINNMINTSKVSNQIMNSKKYKDNYHGWVSLSKHTNIEIPLYESYSFFYITQFLFILNEIGWKDESMQNAKWWNNTLHFIEKNEWEKWRKRSYKAKRKHNWYFLRGRTHMGSHWAGVALYLNKLTKDPIIMKQTAEVISHYNKLLRSNLKIKESSYYNWNSSYDNIHDTDAGKSEKEVEQDVYHANHVVSYILAAYELGDTNWTKKDIQYFAETAKTIYDKEKCIFYDQLDRKTQKWGVNQRNVADGWVKLGAYDSELKEIFEDYNDCFIKRGDSRNFQFLANLKFYLPIK